jgi:two-component system, OmpR family, KDP operon response regulator KdpE
MIENQSKILVVDDEESVRQFLTTTLTSQGYQIEEAISGQAALSKAADLRPDLIILDLGLPDTDGIEVTRQIRLLTRIPIIILSVRGSEADKIVALDAGADDYLTKPFSAGELLARIRVIWRHNSKATEEPVFSNSDLRVDLKNRLVQISGSAIQLTPTEFAILELLIKHAGGVLTHRHILQAVWGEQYGDELHMLHVNISNLRRKIEADPARPQHIITEPGVGYRLRVE